MYLYDDSKDEKILINKDIIITSNGRIYTRADLRYDRQILFRILDREFPNNLKKCMDKTYIYERLGNNLDGLVEAVQETNMFMLYLIENNSYNFFEALREYRTQIPQSEVRSLFKPVFQRYKYLKQSHENLEKIRQDILNSRYPNFRKIKKITLYNVPCVMKSSYLKIINNFWIDLRETEDIDKYGYQNFDCISLGNIKEFDKVEIELTPISSPELKNFSFGFDIKRIVLKVKSSWR